MSGTVTRVRSTDLYALLYLFRFSDLQFTLLFSFVLVLKDYVQTAPPICHTRGCICYFIYMLNLRKGQLFTRPRQDRQGTYRAHRRERRRGLSSRCVVLNTLVPQLADAVFTLYSSNPDLLDIPPPMGRMKRGEPMREEYSVYGFI